MGNANWWADRTSLPKRGFRFLVQIQINNEDLTFMAKSVDRPEFTITTTPHKFFNHTFHYPGRVEWNTISLTLVDAMNPNGSEALYKYLGQIGWVTPLKAARTQDEGDQAGVVSTDLTDTSVTKKRATGATGVVRIQEIDGDGDVGGEWILKNTFITTANFGQHSYESEDLLEVSLTLQYDWAEYKKLKQYPVTT
jgi:hypothetical protein|tara:strand:- start:35 stop:619 length:585 start_codon:yes stop_codon:yes gene_type:complete